MDTIEPTISEYDGIFLITSALRAIQPLTLYSDEDRFRQTVETINSIRKYGPANSIIYLIDGSPEYPNETKLKTIREMGVNIFEAYKLPDVRSYAQNGYKSFLENLILIYFLDWFKKNPVKAKRIYKISGRYTLNENFRNGFDFEDSFVFLESVDSWMPKWKQESTNSKKFFETRLYHMDYSLLETYARELIGAVNNSIQLDVNVEHSIYKAFSKYKVVELKKIGVSGFISSSGEFKND